MIVPSRSVTGLYTPDGSRDEQERILACRLNYIGDDHAHSADIDAYHELKLEDEFADGERAGYTDWVDSSFTQEEVSGFKRTIFTLRKPILFGDPDAQHNVDRPVIEIAFVLRTTSWGVIETGTYHLPDPDPSVTRQSVSELADTVMNRADRLPRPTPDDQWPLFYGHDMSQAELLTVMKTMIANLSDQPNESRDERGAEGVHLLEEFQAEYDVTRTEVRGAIDILEQRGEIEEVSPQLFKPISSVM
jgi:hypothetical protein